MVRKTCLAAVLTLLAAGAIRPAEAHPRFLEPYGRIFQARTFLCTPVDKRPKDALHAQPSNLDDPRQRVIVSPFIRDDDFSTIYGIGAGYANAQNEWHPWSIQGSYFHGTLDGFNKKGQDDEFDGGEVNAKYVLWQPADPKLPVVSIVGAWVHFGDFGDRYDVLLAIDQCITPRLYGTANVGWARLDSDVSKDHDALQVGLGLTYILSSRWSVSADYIFSNAVEGEDTWSAGFLYTFDRSWAIRAGGGKHNQVFANLLWKVDMR